MTVDRNILAGLTMEELHALRDDVLAEVERRYVVETAQDQMTELLDSYREATGRVDGSRWVQPTHALDAYGLGEVVELDDGTHRRSRIPANTTDPHDLHADRWWEEVWLDDGGEWTTDSGDDEIAEWDASKAYYPPAAVTLGGKVYDLIHNNSQPGWRPDDPAMHAVWKVRQ